MRVVGRGEAPALPKPRPRFRRWEGQTCRTRAPQVSRPILNKENRDRKQERSKKEQFAGPDKTRTQRLLVAPRRNGKTASSLHRELFGQGSSAGLSCRTWHRGDQPEPAGLSIHLSRKCSSGCG